MNTEPASLQLLPGEYALIRMTSVGARALKVWAERDSVIELLEDFDNIARDPDHPLNDIATRLKA